VSLLVAVPCAVAAALAYGASTAVEHSAAHESDAGAGANTGSGSGPGNGLWRLVRNPRWLLGMAGDAFGLVLQVLALATGPVVLVQPILVLALPISLPIAWKLGGPRPGRTSYLACGWIIAGLGVFFGLVGNPGDASALPIKPGLIATVCVVVVGAILLLIARALGSSAKAALYGAVAGAWFGFVAVLMDAVAKSWSDHGLHAFTRSDALIPLAALVVIGGASIALTQVAFAVGALGASFPANLTADPVLAVVLGAVLLHETLPSSPLYVGAYVACVAAILVGAVQLAQPSGELS
jgi:drug/metabolite transporter (DMT)-like permease